MKSHFFNFRLIIALLLLSLLALADTGKLYTSDNMSSSMTNCIVQDSYGYIWVGSEYGLNKFDGYHFTTYFADTKDSTSIIDNEVSCFLVDSKKRLWIGFSKGLEQYDYGKDCFRKYPFPNHIFPRVEDVMEDADGNILMGTAGYGLYCIKAGEDKITKLDEYKKSNTDEYYRKLFEDEQHHLWRSNHLNKITRIKVNNLHPTSFKDYMTDCGPAVGFLKMDHSGIIVVCMYGIMRYDYRTGTMSDACFDLTALDRKVSIRKALLDSKGNIYIGTSGKGLMMIPHGSKTLKPVENRNGSFDLSSSNINDIYEDKDKNLWLSCYKKGLFQFNSGSEAFSSWSLKSQNFILGSSVSSIAAGENGDVLCTVQKNGVYKFSPNGKITVCPTSPDGPNTIYRDKQGKYWLCTENTLYSYNPATGACTQKGKFDGWGLNCMTDDGDGILYICNYGKGLCIYNTNTGELSSISMYQQDKAKGGLCNDWVKVMFVDNRGLLWIGCADGLSCMNPADHNFRIFGWDVQLSGIQCLSICENGEGNMLIGTSAGLYLFDRKHNRLSEFPHSSPLRNISIYSIVIDRSGDMWMSTANGIWQYDHKRKHFISHVNGNGLVTKEYIPGAMLHDADDRIIFGTNDGITSFYPDKVRNMRMKMKKVFLTAFRIGGKSTNVFMNEFEIPYNDNSFEMEFSLLNFKNTDNITFQYNINNSNEWISLPEGSNRLSFTKLKPGKYVFTVRAEKNGEYSSEVKTITVNVDGPWYASTWAYLFYFMLIMAVLVIALIAYERRRRVELEEAKMKFLIDATHDIRSPLTLIMGPLNKLKKRLNGDEVNKAEIDIIEHNAQRLLLLVNQILDERKIDKNQMRLHCRETDMVKFVAGICTLYQFNARQRNIAYKFTHDEGDVIGWIDRINFEKVITNLLSNAFKYTSDNGEIEVRLTHDEKRINILVLDTGVGFKDENTEKLFERFYQGHNTEGKNVEGTGIGLNLSRALVNMHGGKIIATKRSDGKSGACLTVTIPTGNTHLKPEEVVVEEENTENTKTKKRASRNLKILVVDDDYDIAQYIKDELSDWFKFDLTNNGKDALSALLSNNYDLVISDVMMPEMDGITLLKKIKSNSLISDVPVILLTSKGDVDDRMEGFKEGADGYIAKPFSMDELHVLIDNLIDNVRRLRGKFSGVQEQEGNVETMEVKGNNDALMERIMKSINENLSNTDFNVEMLTDDIGLSRAQLHRKMKEITGISTSEFIRNLRLEQAAKLIKEGKINVQQVAYSVGFNNQTHFSTVFKKHFGLSPTEYASKSVK
jgi:signal transduction histidine kinase/DNA-binding response OmpR family regulator/ligand-binding sensor domain-containing protein